MKFIIDLSEFRVHSKYGNLTHFILNNFCNVEKFISMLIDTSLFSFSYFLHLKMSDNVIPWSMTIENEFIY